MAPHSSTLAWKISWAEEPGRLQSMGSLRVGYDCAPSLSPFTFMHWRRKWQLTPVFLPGESQGQGSLVGFRLWGRTESDMTETTQQQQQQGHQKLSSRHTSVSKKASDCVSLLLSQAVVRIVGILTDLVHITIIKDKLYCCISFKDKEAEAQIG